MKTRLLVVIVIAFGGLPLSSYDALAAELRIVDSIDMPPPSGYRHDIAWGEEALWTLSVAFDGPPQPYDFPPQPIETARVHQLRPSDGSVISTFGLGMYNHAGLVWDGAALWIGNTNSVAGTHTYGSPADTLPDSVEMLSPDGDLLGSFSAPHSPDAHTQGIAWDGNHLWISDRKHREIIEVDPTDGRVISTFGSPGTEPDSLAWDGNSLWNLDRADDAIYRLDTFGNVLDRWSLGVSEPVGLASDGQYLWVLDDDTDKAYQVAIPEPSTATMLAIAVILLLLTLRRGRKRQLTLG